LFVVFLTSALPAQGICPCAQRRAFGSCAVEAINDTFVFGPYPDSSPGSVAVVTDPAGETFAYIPDLFSGRTHRYFVDSTLNRLMLDPDTIRSPGGSRATTGIAFVETPADDFLVWAVEGRLYRTGIDGESPVELPVVQLDTLALALREDLEDPGIPVGALGGITYHPTRGSFWGVDIVNDVYFEFDMAGNVVFENGEASYFLNPLRDEVTGGAYGNSITYVSVPGGEFFDIPVGALPDRGPSRVLRVHATRAGNPEPREIGDETGVFYPIGSAIVSSGFVTGIGFWPDFCGGGQNVEFLLEVNARDTSRPQVLVVSADDPNGTSVADIACFESAPNAVTLSWRKTTPYARLTIDRRAVGDDTPVPVFDGLDFVSDPESITDQGVVPGSYEYVFSVASGGDAIPTQTCAITVERGVIVASAPFALEGVDDPLPFAITVVRGETVLVADLIDGDARSFDLDLNPLGEVSGPFSEGFTSGLAYRPADDRLYWLQNLGGRHFLQKTTVEGTAEGTPVLLDTPFNLIQGVSLGDLSHDPGGDYFWSVDLFNSVIYPLNPDGSIPPAFREAQLPSPVQDGALSGGIELVSGEGSTAILDVPVGEAGAELADGLRRSTYDTGSLGLVEEVFRIDLGSAVGAGDPGSVALLRTETQEFLFVTAKDTRTVYKLSLGDSGKAPGSFRRGEVNDDGALNISDPSFSLNFLFRQGPAPACQDAADANNDEVLDVSDPIFLFNYLFLRGATPPAPFASCGLDAEPALDCLSVSCV
jgi:hypothetical protein